MRDKIKLMFGTLLRGMFGGWRGTLGAALMALSIYLWLGFFTGDANIQNYVRNMRDLGRAGATIAEQRRQLDQTNHHIKLIQEHSPDFVSEMAARYLNLGDPKLMILKK